MNEAFAVAQSWAESNGLIACNWRPFQDRHWFEVKGNTSGKKNVSVVIFYPSYSGITLEENLEKTRKWHG